MLTKKDICVVIATYKRVEDVNKTLLSLIKYDNIPGKIIIVDQSKDNKTKEITQKYKKKLNIEYVKIKLPSSSIAKNIGIKKAKNFPLILILDDDVDLLKNYMKEMLNEFNSDTKIMGIGGEDLNPLTQKFEESFKVKLKNLVLKLFYLPYFEKNKFKITGPYGIVSGKLEKPIRDAQWLRGFCMGYQSKLFENYLCPESKGYNVLEDIDSSYYVYKKYGKGSLVVTPKCKAIHRYTQTARYAEKKRIFVNHEDHFAFYYLHFNNFLGTIKFFLSLSGIILGHFCKFVIKPNKNNLLSLKYNFEAILYCLENRKNIKNKKYRAFLNDDLTMK